MRKLVTIGLLLAACLLVAACSSLSWAQAKPGGFARQLALGGSQAGSGVVLNPFVYEDPAYMYLNPAWQSAYRNYVWTNVGGGSLNNLSTGNNGYGVQNAGINFGVTEQLALGMIFSHDPSAAAVTSSLIGGNATLVPFPGITGRAQNIPFIANVWEVVASYDMGSLAFGLSFLYGTSNFDSTASAPNVPSTELEASSSVFGVRAGFLLELSNANHVSGHVAFRSTSATDKITGLGEYSASGTELEFAARARLRMSNRVNLVPYGMYAMYSGEPEEDTPPTAGRPAGKTEVSASALAIGVGFEWKNSDIYIAGGVSYQMASIEGEVTDTVGTNLPGTKINLSNTGLPVINLGAEWWFLDWLSARAGYFRSMGSTSVELTVPVPGGSFTGESNRTTPFSNLIIGGINPATWDGIVTLGIGLRFENFSLDATVSDEALRRGLGLLGSADNINTFGYITLNYNFD